MRRILIAAILALTVPMPAIARGPAIPESAKQYGRDMAVTMAKAGPVALEPIYDEGLAIVADPHLNLDDYDEPTFQKLRKIMVGFFLARSDEGNLIFPQWDAFLRLAREKGTKADQAFFAAQGLTYPDKDQWPAYIEAQTDYSGCTILDGKTLTRSYGVWVKFQNRYPNQYQKDSQDERKFIEDRLDESVCVCGEEPDASKEFESILKTYPGTPIATEVKLLVDSLRDGTSDIRFRCLSG